MSCRPGYHDYRPFSPRDRDLYCRLCGRVMEHESPGDEELRTARSAQRVPAQQSLPLDLPPTAQEIAEVEEARRIIAERAASRPDDLERNVTAILERYDLDPGQAEEMLRDALAFGSTLDLDHFERVVAQMPARGGRDRRLAEDRAALDDLTVPLTVP